jgi:hypothetical protein
VPGVQADDSRVRQCVLPVELKLRSENLVRRVIYHCTQPTRMGKPMEPDNRLVITLAKMKNTAVCGVARGEDSYHMMIVLTWAEQTGYEEGPLLHIHPGEDRGLVVPQQAVRLFGWIGAVVQVRRGIARAGPRPAGHRHSDHGCLAERAQHCAQSCSKQRWLSTTWRSHGAVTAAFSGGVHIN